MNDGEDNFVVLFASRSTSAACRGKTRNISEIGNPISVSARNALLLWANRVAQTPSARKGVNYWKNDTSRKKVRGT